MSETTKQRLDLSARDQQRERQSRTSDDTRPIDEAESQMRKALGLLGDTPRHQVEPERSQRLGRPSSNLGASGSGLQRRRFVQDGDVPVTVLRREAHDPIPQRAALSGVAPTSSRLQRVEAALAAESATRETAERSLQEAQTTVRDLQTKTGHADLAKNEAIEALQREREANAQALSELDSLQTELQMLRGEFRDVSRLLKEIQDTLADERKARNAAELARHQAETAREEAERLVRTLSKAGSVVRPAKSQRTASKATGELFAAEPSGRGTSEPEPVKWWLNTAPAGKRR